jgi:Domain of unknown function (DUF1996)
MKSRYRGPSSGNPTTVRIIAASVALAASGILTVTFVSGGGKGTADAATDPSQYVPIQRVAPTVASPRPGPKASRGRFTVNCGTNGNGKFSPDNPVAQPGIRNGAEHLHDFVGNLAITAFSSDADLEASGTTCRNGDKSSYFWPVVRIDSAVRAGAADVRRALATTSGTVVCPSVRDRLPAVPPGARETVARLSDGLARMAATADERVRAVRGIDQRRNNAVLGRLRADRARVLARMGTVIERAGGRWPARMVSLADCDVSYDGVHAALHQQARPNRGARPTASTPGPTPAAPGPVPAAPGPTTAAPEPQGRNLELPNNTGGVVRPAAVLIEYRGNAAAKVVPMPKFLRELTGDAKPTSRGPANARATWTCSGFADRLADKYPICPPGSRVQRVQDFPGCWDGSNTDSANHRDHVAFADRTTGACPQGFVAIPQLRITISYAIPRDVQLKGQYALDSFPEENHNPFSDHNDFVNVNSAQTMQRIATCINQDRACA